jgi:hypothetical protein
MELDWSQHRLILTIIDGCLHCAVRCDHDPDDMTRPCWPHDIEHVPPIPLPAPQPCALAADEMAADEMLHGVLKIEWEIHDVEWCDRWWRIRLGGFR